MLKTKNNTLNYKITQNITKPTVFRRKKKIALSKIFLNNFAKHQFTILIVVYQAFTPKPTV